MQVATFTESWPWTCRQQWECADRIDRLLLRHGTFYWRLMPITGESKIPFSFLALDHRTASPPPLCCIPPSQSNHMTSRDVSLLLRQHLRLCRRQCLGLVAPACNKASATRAATGAAEDLKGSRGDQLWVRASLLHLTSLKLSPIFARLSTLIGLARRSCLATAALSLGNVGSRVFRWAPAAQRSWTLLQ